MSDTIRIVSASLLCLIGAVMCTLMILSCFNRYLGVWACKRLGWHLKPEELGFDGCSNHGICPRCLDKVMQDSQGNWF